MERYGRNIRAKLAIDFDCEGRYVFNQITDKTVRAFKTREQARRYLIKYQKRINV